MPLAADAELESTATLLARVRDGEEDARERLGVRYLALLERWAHGRVPPRARRFADTDDLVQTTLLRALNAVQHFEPRREGAFLAYLRKILLNQLRTAVQRADAGPPLPTGGRGNGVAVGGCRADTGGAGAGAALGADG